MENVLKVYEGLMGISSLSQGTSSSYTQTCSEMIKHVKCYNGTLGGDRKNPTPFGFHIMTATGGPRILYIMEQYGGLPAYTLMMGNSLEGGNTGLYSALTPDFGLTGDRAITKIYEKIRGHSNIIVDLAESGATIKMLRNALNVKKMMAEVVRQAVIPKRGRRSTGQKRLDYVTSKWLEGRYGWLPLVHSTYDALKTLDRKVSGGLVVMKGRSGAAESDIRISGGSGGYFDPQIREDIKLQFRTEYVIQFGLPSTNSLYDWTSLNPAGIAWELLPLSFVADWFVNVGDTLALWENYLIFANKFIRGYRTDSYREEYKWSLNGLSRYPPTYANGVMQDGKHLQEDHRNVSVVRLFKYRAPLSALPQPESGIRCKVNLNSKRLLDASALIHNVVRSLK